MVRLAYTAARLVSGSTRVAVSPWFPSCKNSLSLPRSAFKRAGQRPYETSSTPGAQIKRPSILQEAQTPDESSQTEEACAINSIEEFEQLVEQGKANVSTARLYLEWSKGRLIGLPLEKQREEAAKIGAGRLLSWLWRCRGEETRESDFDRSLAENLCWHLTAENKGMFIWQWLEIEAANAMDNYREGTHLDTEWRGQLLAGLVVARLHWDNGSADAAMALVVSAAESLNMGRTMMYACIRIEKALLVPFGEPLLQYSATSIEAYTKAQKLVRNPKHLPLTLAMLDLFHPTHSDATRALRWYQGQNEQPDQYSMPRRKSAQVSQAAFMARTSYILRLRGQREDADWLDARTQQLFSSILRGGSGFTELMYRRIHADPRLKALFNSSPHAEEVLATMNRVSVIRKSLIDDWEAPSQPPTPLGRPLIRRYGVTGAFEQNHETLGNTTVRRY